MNLNRVFVYGTLVPGREAANEMYCATPVGFVQTIPEFDLKRATNGGFALVPGCHAVVGYLYEVSDDHLLFLDDYEDSCYERKQISLSDGSTAYAYMLLGT